MNRTMSHYTRFFFLKAYLKMVIAVSIFLSPRINGFKEKPIGRTIDDNKVADKTDGQSVKSEYTPEYMVDNYYRKPPCGDKPMLSARFTCYCGNRSLSGYTDLSKGSLQKKNKKNCYNGGGSRRQNVTFPKVVFKIHFRPF